MKRKKHLLKFFLLKLCKLKILKQTFYFDLNQIFLARETKRIITSNIDLNVWLQFNAAGVLLLLRKRAARSPFIVASKQLI